MHFGLEKRWDWYDAAPILLNARTMPNKHIGHQCLDARDLQRVDVVDHGAAELAEEGAGAHDGC